jgi:hypothetical protein
MTLFLTLGALVVSGLPVFLRHAIAAAEIFGHFRATVVPETSEIDSAVSVFVNHDCDSFGLHTASYLTPNRSRIAVHRRSPHLAPLKHVALGPRHGNRLLLLVDLLNLGQPFPVIADLLVATRSTARQSGPRRTVQSQCRWMPTTVPSGG